MDLIWDIGRKSFVVEKRIIQPRKPSKVKPAKAKKRVESRMVQEVINAAKAGRFPTHWWKD